MGTEIISRPHQGPVVGAIAQVGLLATLTATTGLGAVGWLVGVAHALAVCVALDIGLRRRGGTSGLGPADRVTLARMTLAGGVAALVADTVRAPAPTAVLVGLAAVALALDAVDGTVARRTGTVSALGARFDMEADAFLILALSVHVAGSLGPWVLAIGLMRYVFFAAGRPLPWLNAPLPPSMARKTVAAAQGIVLVVATAGVLPRPAAAVLVASALAALTWSFGRDIAWLYRNRRDEAAPVRTRVQYRLIAPVVERPAPPVKQPHPAGTRG
ncbi:MAG: CDP-alcohol phosphatidyltransferase family protein [Actinomadura rubrobrunea]|nr:CDP-alcohol phosphatidyltransferase family protein [Actinomadura rubrobrunea]